MGRREIEKNQRLHIVGTDERPAACCQTRDEQLQKASPARQSLQYQGHRSVRVWALQPNRILLRPRRITPKLQGRQCRENLMKEDATQLPWIVTANLEFVSDMMASLAFALYICDSGFHPVTDSW